MAAAFERAGWVNFERTISMTWQAAVESKVSQAARRSLGQLRR
jgi:hypothetical protein